MPKTINAYTPDQGELVLTVSAAAVAAITGLTTAEAINLDGVVRKFEETTTKTKEYSEVYIAGDSNPIKTISSKVNATIWSLTIVDDYSEGAAGEWGTDNLAALQLLQLYFDNDFTLEDLAVTPAGGTTGDIETTLTNVDVQSISHPMVDADSNAPNEVTITLVVESYAKAAHA